MKEDLKKAPDSIRPFFFAAMQFVDKEYRPCMINSQSVAGLRPYYPEKDAPSGTETWVLTYDYEQKIKVEAPYASVRAFFERQGYVFVDVDEMKRQAPPVHPNRREP